MTKEQNPKEASPPKKGVVKTTAKVVFLPILAPFYIAGGILRGLRQRIRAFGVFIVSFPEILRSEKGRWRQAITEQRERPQKSDRAIFQSWGVVTKADAARKKRELRFHMVVWAVAFAFGLFLAAVAPNNTTLVAGFAVICTAVCASLNACWRYKVLASRRFVYFTDWITGKR